MSAISLFINQKMQAWAGIQREKHIKLYILESYGRTQLILIDNRDLNICFSLLKHIQLLWASFENLKDAHVLVKDSISDNATPNHCACASHCAPHRATVPVWSWFWVTFVCHFCSDLSSSEYEMDLSMQLAFFSPTHSSGHCTAFKGCLAYTRHPEIA